MSRAGRKRKLNTKREKNGRPSRAGSADRMKSTVVQARQRVHGMTKAEAEQPIADDFIGRLVRGGEITTHQYQAALQYEQDVMDFRRVIHTPKEAGAVDLNRVQGKPTTSEDDQIERAQKIKGKFDRMQTVIREAQASLRGASNLNGALDAIVMQRCFAPHLVGDLREALNVLVRHYGLDRAAA